MLSQCLDDAVAYLIEMNANGQTETACTPCGRLALLQAVGGVRVVTPKSQRTCLLSTSFAQRIVMLTETKAVSVVCQPQLLIRFGIIFVRIDLFNSAITL